MVAKHQFPQGIYFSGWWWWEEPQEVKWEGGVCLLRVSAELLREGEEENNLSAGLFHWRGTYLRGKKEGE